MFVFSLNHHMYNDSIPLFISKNLSMRCAGNTGNLCFFFRLLEMSSVPASFRQLGDFGHRIWDWHPNLVVHLVIYLVGVAVCWQTCCSAEDTNFGYKHSDRFCFGKARKGPDQGALHHKCDARIMGSDRFVLMDNEMSDCPAFRPTEANGTS